MGTQGRGWDDERVVRSETTVGVPVDIVIGLTRDPRHPGRQVVGLAIGDGPTGVLRIDGSVGNGSELIEDIRLALAKLLKVNRAGGVR